MGTAEILRNCREGEDDDGRRVEDQRAAATTDADANDRENFFFVEDCCNFSCSYKHIARKGSRLKKKILGRLFPQLLWPHAAAAAAGGGALRPRPRLWCSACAANKEQSFFVKENRRAFGRVFS